MFAEELDESTCDYMGVYSRQHPLAPLTDLARYADTLIETADRNVRTIEALKDRLFWSTVNSNKL